LTTFDTPLVIDPKARYWLEIAIFVSFFAVRSKM